MRIRTLAVLPALLLGLAVAAAACTSGESAPTDTPVATETPGGYIPPSLPTAPEVAYPPADAAAPTAESGSPIGDAETKLALTETYVNPEFGYEIDYPTAWFVQGDGQTVMISSFDPAAAPGTGGIPSDQTKIDIMALEGFPLDLDARVAQIEAEAASSGAEAQVEPMELGGGEPAVLVRMSGGMAGESFVVVTILGDQLYQVQAYGNPMPLPAIARTLRAAGGATGRAGVRPAG